MLGAAGHILTERGKFSGKFVLLGLLAAVSLDTVDPRYIISDTKIMYLYVSASCVFR